MLEQMLVQVLLLLGATVGVVLVFQKLHIPPSLAYLSVGVLLSSNTAGPVVSEEIVSVIAEYGIVFLLFTIGLSFSLPQIYALRHTILGLGTAQVALTTLFVSLIAWLLGFSPATSFVIGAVFAQSSTTIISKQLLEQNESETRHGRLGTTLSVFQDITAVPFIVVIPVLGVAAAQEVAGELGIALFNAAMAFGIVLFAGHFLLQPLFHVVAKRRSAELFTLTVLFVSLIAAWTTKTLGLSMAFGAFLAGMVLGETQFRHQVESTIRPFRDVLLGLFFVSVGMLFDPAYLPDIWHLALASSVAILILKLLIVMAIVKISGVDIQTAFRTGILVAVGGEFGFALLAVGLEGSVIDTFTSQIVLTAVLFSMIIGPFLIRYNHSITSLLFQTGKKKLAALAKPDDAVDEKPLKDHVIICGFGRTGQVVARFLESENIPYKSIEIDPTIVKEAQLAKQPVIYGDTSDADILSAANIETASLLLISHNDHATSLKTLIRAKEMNPNIETIVRAKDETSAEPLRKAGASEVIPETLETGLMLVSHSLLALRVPHQRINDYITQQRTSRYPLIRELFKGKSDIVLGKYEDPETEKLHSVLLDEDSPCLGKKINQLTLEQKYSVYISVLVRGDKRHVYPDKDTVLEAGDVLVLFGRPEQLKSAERQLIGAEPSDDDLSESTGL
ncbi:MAG: sodium:proton exchanger [Rickettsiales bacterium]|nr:sodium:proton exchanger [Rickettsiales bacterium]